MLRRVITKYFVNDWTGELPFDILYNLSFDCDIVTFLYMFLYMFRAHSARNM